MSHANFPRLWIIVAATVVGWLSVCPAASGQQAPVRTVLALYLGEEEFPTNPVTQSALREALTSRSDIPVEYFGEFLEGNGSRRSSRRSRCGSTSARSIVAGESTS